MRSLYQGHTLNAVQAELLSELLECISEGNTEKAIKISEELCSELARKEDIQ